MDKFNELIAQSINSYMTENASNLDTEDVVVLEDALSSLKGVVANAKSSDKLSFKDAVADEKKKLADSHVRKNDFKAAFADAKNIDDATEASNKHLSAGEISIGVGIFAAAAAAAIAVVAKVKGNKNVDKKVEPLRKKIAELKSKAKSGEITAKEAKAQIAELNKEIKALQKEAKSAEVKESVNDVDANELKLDIYESAAAGEISEEERDLLLSMI